MIFSIQKIYISNILKRNTFNILTLKMSMTKNFVNLVTSVTSRDSTATSNKQIKKPMKGSRQHYSECDFIVPGYRQIYRSIG